MSSGETRRSPQSDIGGKWAGQQLARLAQVQVTPAEPVHVALELGAASVQGGCELGMERWRASRRVRAIEHDQRLDAGKRLGDGRRRKRPEGADSQQPDRLAPVAQLVDCLLDRAGGRAQRDDSSARTLEPIVVERSVASPGERLELRDLVDRRQRRVIAATCWWRSS
jgi:hypothetical protein